MRITYYGHSCFLVEIGGQKLLFDPFITDNPQNAAKSIDISTIHPNYILLSHGHADHVADVEEIAKQSDAQIIGVAEVAAWYENKGLKGIGMNIGGCHQFNFGTLRVVAAVHSSSFPDGSYAGNPVGFVISNENSGTFYFAGDTALTFDMKLIPQLCPRLDFTILPIGNHFTMGYKDAIIASDFVQCNTVIGCHFDTFEPIKIDHKAAKNAFSQANKTLFLPAIGMSFNIKKKG